MEFDLSTFDALSTQPNVFGGEDVFGDNSMVGHTEPNVFGGENYHSTDGSVIATSQPNVFGGVNISMEVNSNPFSSDIPDFTF